MISRQAGRALAAAFIALAIVAGAFFTAWGSPVRSQDALLAAAPAELAIPGDAQQLGQWCRDRQAQGTAGLTSRARNWLTDCIALFGAPSGPSASPSATQSASPSPSPSVQPSPSVTPSASTSPAPSPSASPTPSPTVLTGCIPLPSRCGYPDSSNTGANGALTLVQGDVTLRTAGQVYADRDVHGCINVTAGNVVIRNVRVTCGGGYVIDYFGDVTRQLTIEDTTVVCTNPRGTGIGERGLVVRRVDVSGCENGFDLDSDALIEDTWCHGLTSETDQPEAHVDCVQGIQTNDITIRHSTLIAPRIATSAIEGDCGTCSGIVRVRWSVTGSLLDGGGYTLYCTARSTEQGSVVSGNRFGSNQWTGPGGYATSCDAGVSWSGNVRDSDGSALAPR